MARPKKAASNTDASGANSNTSTPETPSAAKSPRKRKTEDEQIAEYTAKLAAIQQRKVMRALAEHKGLAAALKAAEKIRDFVDPLTFIAVQRDLRESVEVAIGTKKDEPSSESASSDDGDGQGGSEADAPPPSDPPRENSGQLFDA